MRYLAETRIRTGLISYCHQSFARQDLIKKIIMVILDYNATDRSYLTITSIGPQEVIFFQEGFYRLELCFQSLDDAVRRCRRDLDYRGVFSIVVQRAEGGEVWVRLTDDGLNIFPSTQVSDPAPESGLLKRAS